MYDDHTKHLRAEPIDHRLTVAVECGGPGVIPPTTDRLERTGCPDGRDQTPWSCPRT